MESEDWIMMIIYSLTTAMVVITMIGLLIEMTTLFKALIRIMA